MSIRWFKEEILVGVSECYYGDVSFRNLDCNLG